MTDPGPRLLQLKILLRDVHPAVWRRVRQADQLSIPELHRVIQILMGLDDDHLHRFRIHGRDYGIAYIGGPNFGEDAAAVPLSWFRFRPMERFLYEYDFTCDPAWKSGSDAISMTWPGSVTRTVARFCSAGRMAHDHLVCPPPISP